MTFSDLASVPPDPPAPFTDQLRLAVAAYLARFKGSARVHTESDLRCYLSWCAEHALDPLAAQRPHRELYATKRPGRTAPRGSCLLASRTVAPSDSQREEPGHLRDEDRLEPVAELLVPVRPDAAPGTLRRR
jgi:hypothetical protein